MSNFNQRGPMGDGPMTGRKMGRCTNYGAARNNQINQETRLLRIQLTTILKEGSR